MQEVEPILTRDAKINFMLSLISELSAENLEMVSDFALHVRRSGDNVPSSAPQVEVPELAPSHLQGLVGLVNWGGDALADTERLYDEP